MNSKLIISILLLLVISQAVTTYSYSDIKGKVISLKSRQKGKWLTHNGELQSEGPYDTNNASIRFLVEEYNSNEFYLRSRQNNRLVSRKNGSKRLESTSNLFDRFKLQTKDSHNVFYSSRTNRYISTSPSNQYVYIIYYGNLDWNIRHQQWEILIHECPEGQAYKNDGSGQCVSSCEVDEYMGDYKCEKCSDGCDRCTKANDCQSCLQSHVFLGNGCVVATTFTNQYIAIKSNRGNDYLRDRGNDVVKSDQGSIGSEERFTFERTYNGLVSIKGGKNNKYCQDNNDQLFCNDNYRFSDARWRIYKNSDGTYSFKNDSSGKFMRTAEKTKKVMWWREHKYYYIKVDRDSIGSHEKYKLTFNA